MPTGYTYRIEDGCSFEEFVWGCARGFGACIMMRDDPADKPVPDKFEPSDYHAKKIDEAKAELDRLDAMTAQEIDQAIKSERDEAIAANTRNAVEHQQKKARYEDMLDRVKEWEPPSPDHRRLKSFMIEQIEMSIPSELYQRDLPVCAPAEWLAGKKSDAQRDLAYHHAEYAKEVERTNSRNLWVQQLQASVPQPVKKLAA